MKVVAVLVIGVVCIATIFGIMEIGWIFLAEEVVEFGPHQVQLENELTEAGFIQLEAGAESGVWFNSEMLIAWMPSTYTPAGYVESWQELHHHHPNLEIVSVVEGVGVTLRDWDPNALMNERVKKTFQTGRIVHLREIAP